MQLQRRIYIAGSDTLRAWVQRLDWRVVVALAATYVLFGSGPAAASAAIKTLPPFLVIATRSLIAGTILTVWALWAGAPPPTWRQWRAAGLIGLLILTFGAAGGTYGQLTVPSGVAGVLSALLPLFAACIGFAVFGERIPRRAIAGLVIGFLGIALLLRPGSNLDMFGVAMIVAGQIAWSLGAELSPRVGLPDDPRLAAGTELLSGGVVVLIIAILFGDFGRLHLAAVSTTSWLGLGWFIIIATGGFTAFGYLTQNVPPSIATTFSYVNPVIAVTLGWALFSEPVTLRMMLATATIIVGVCLIISTKSDAPAKMRHPFTSGHGHVMRQGRIRIYKAAE
jgi:drug/metabolite transporter (DMT)-like permease